VHVIGTADGRVITGVVADETEAALTIQTINERIVVPLAEVERRMASPVSLMPDGLLQNISTGQVRELLAYLMGPEQVPLPESPPTGTDDTNPKR